MIYQIETTSIGRSNVIISKHIIEIGNTIVFKDAKYKVIRKQFEANDMNVLNNLDVCVLICNELVDEMT